MSQSKNEEVFSRQSGSLLDRLLQKLRIKRIIPYIPNGAVVCDVGCGYEGVMLHDIKKIISRGVGLDQKINVAYCDDKIRLDAVDLNQPLPLEDNTFDVVISLANIEHLENRLLALQEIRRILKPGGILLLTTPSIYGKPVLEFLAYRLHIINEYSIRDHKIYFSKNTLLKLCEAAGFHTCKHRYFQLYMNNFLEARK